MQKNARRKMGRSSFTSPIILTVLCAPIRSGPRWLRGSLYWLALFALCLSFWIHRCFGKPDLSQLAYHLAFGAELVDTVDPVLTERFIKWCLLAPLLLLLMLVYAERRTAGWIARLPPQRRPLLSRLHRWFPQLLVLAVSAFWMCDVSALKYVSADFGPDYFGAHYVPPASVRLQARAPKNLILIYVESLERGYADRTRFGHDLLAPLNGLPGVGFAHYQQAPGTGWTIAALVATQCGVPLERLTIFDGNTQGQVMDSFLKNAVCLPDLLAQRGYRNVFMGGASTAFAGKDKFLAQHHYHEVYGREQWLRSGVAPQQMNGWGLYDADLFSRARTKLRQLEAAPQRFALTLLTVDTHEPEGHLSAACAQRGYQGFDGVLSCTTQEVADFVRFVQDSGYLEDTNIVILGDHLARRNPLSEQLAQSPERSIYNRFIAKEVPAPNRQQLLHFDMLPTILEFVGYTVEGGRLALGYSGFNPHAQAPSGARVADMERDLLNRSDSYLDLWGVAAAD